ncbi:MAG: hypothetical protein ACI935_000081 [Moritella dasanensis]|jgi:hypothetical protein|nr:hypothetical protein [Moritella viscosa]SHO06876.1 Putative uncharacterized protein [Moritella viscosa]
MNTVQSVINEIMFIAMSRPDAIDITVEYHGLGDSIFIHVLRSNINVGRMTTQGLSDAVLFSKYIRLDGKASLLDDNKKTPLEAVLNAKSKILALMATPVSTAVAA